MDRIAEVKNRNGGSTDRAIKATDRASKMNTSNLVVKHEICDLTISCFLFSKKRACKIYEICIYCI